jgi:hypothetical protein
MPRRKIISAIHPFDTRHGTDTSGLLLAEVIAQGTNAVLEELTAYYGVAPSILEGIVNQWLRLKPVHSIERYASQFPFAAVQGIELNSSLAEIARDNIDKWMRDEHSAPLAPITLHHADATIHPLPRTPTLAFLFHPFEAPILKRFLKHIEDHLAIYPNAFDLLYVNSEHGSLLDLHPAFTRLWEGRVPMSTQDHIADLAAIAQQKEYGSTGDELCSVYRFSGRLSNLKKKFAT